MSGSERPVPPLVCRDLRVSHRGGVRAVRGVSFVIEAGECLALVGESGCGKTTIARATLGLLPADAAVAGSIRVSGTEVIGASSRTLRRLRGLVAGFVAQDPFAACNPLARVEEHVAEAWRTHGRRPPEDAVVHALTALGLVDAATWLRRYPHQWSGGMLQRATIAAAAAHRPPLIVADEPTSALDADRADATLVALRATGAAILLVSHDLGLVARHADRIAVCYAGRIVETDWAAVLIERPRHPYTRALLAALPRPGHGLPEPLPDSPPDLAEADAGCAFAPRCRYAEPTCGASVPPLRDGVACPVLPPLLAAAAVPPPDPVDSAPVASPSSGSRSTASSRPRRRQPATNSAPALEARGLAKTYRTGGRAVPAVVAADLRVDPGEIVGIGGPSGCGKSTLLRLLATIESPTHGTLRLDGTPIHPIGGPPRPFRRRRSAPGFVMPIFQDPVTSLDPRWPIWRTMTEPLCALPRTERPAAAERRALARIRTAEVGLAGIDLDARPGELSVGQCQRVAIARALVAKPGLLVADEPTSALDASMSAAILRLLAGVASTGTALVVVSHDRLLLDVLCHRVLRMVDGVLTA